jgi:Tfp pilus assembly protein PilF
MSAHDSETAGGRRLSTWKEIASYFGKDERTVKRWEATRKLPVRRLPNGPRSTVFAYENDLAEWLAQAGTTLPRVPQADMLPRSGKPALVSFSKPLRKRLGVSLATGVAAIIAVVFVVRSQPEAEERRGTANAQAAELYRSGVYEWQTRTPAGLKRAVEDLTEAIVRDPAFAEAYAGLATAYNLEREFADMPASEAYPRMQAAAERAIAINPSLGSAHASLAFVNFYWLRRVPEARREFERALALAPRDAMVHKWFATFLAEIGDSVTALREIDTAQRLDGESSAILADKGFILYYAGEKDAAIALLQRLEEARPDFPSAHSYLSSFALYRGDNVAYLRELRQAALVRHDAVLADLAAAGDAGLAKDGRRGMLEAIVARELQFYAQGRIPAYCVAGTYGLLGDAPSAMLWLRRSLARNEPATIGIGIDPAFAFIRDRSDFRALVMQAGLS